MSRIRAVGVLVLVIGSAPAHGQEPANLRGESLQTRKRLVEAEQKLAAGKGSEAADDLQRILDEAGDDLISIDGKQFRSARWVAHGMLVRLPADALKSYRDRIDGPATKLLELAKKHRDPKPLRQLLDRYFVSRPADEGLLLLGELLFDRAEFRAAESQWRRLLPGQGADIDYPGSVRNPAGVWARIVLAIIFQNEPERAHDELKQFRSKYPDAMGTLAAKAGSYAELLQSYLDRPPGLIPAANAGLNWPTVGGGPDRSGRVDVRLSGEWPSRPTWEHSPAFEIRHPAAPQAPPARPPICNPVVSNGWVFATNGWKLFAYTLSTGEELAPLELARPQKTPVSDRAPPEISPSLAADGDLIYVRVGPGIIRPSDGKRAEETTIVCVARSTRADGKSRLSELWRIKPPAEDAKTPVFWEGAPLVSGRRMWAAYGRFEAGRIVHGIAHYDPSNPGSAPERAAWTAEVADSPSPGLEGRTRHELLTLSDNTLVFCTNSGLIVGLESSTGRRVWAFRYPRARKPESTRLPDAAPAIASGGRVFVAPTDAVNVYALDAATGTMLWESEPVDGAQLIGITAGRLIISVAGPVRSLRGLRVGTGKYREPDGWIQHDGTGVLGYGRGFVTEEVIVWPTRSGLCFLRAEDGGLISEPWRRLEGERPTGYFGNVLYADGVLIVATASQLCAYLSEAKRFGPPDPQTERDPVQARFDRLVTQAEGTLARGNERSARVALLALAQGDLPREYRAWAAARLLLLTGRVVDESQLPADLLAILTPELRQEWLFSPDGVPITLGSLIDRHTGSAAFERLRSVDRPEPATALPDTGHRFHSGTEIRRTLRLPSGSALLRPIRGGPANPRYLYIAANEELTRVDFASGDQARFASEDSFTHATELSDGFVAAGPRAIALYGIDQAPKWVFRVPVTEPLPRKPGDSRISCGTVFTNPELTSFTLISGCLIVQMGNRHLLGLDLKLQKVAWVLGADGKLGYRPYVMSKAACFGVEFHADPNHLLVQLSDGRRWLIESKCGRVVDLSTDGNPTAKTWWQDPPQLIAASRVLVADGGGLVRLLNLSTGRVKWTYSANAVASLAGDPPRMRRWGETLLVATRRNHGVQLERLDLGDGTPIWPSGGAFLDADRVNLAHADSDGEYAYIAHGSKLAAIALKDGKSAWEIDLRETADAGGWIVHAGERGILVAPENAIPREPIGVVMARLRHSFEREPALWRLPGLAASAYDAWITRSVPILLLDSATGKKLARFDLPARGPEVLARVVGNRVVVATGDRVVWFR